MRRSWNIKIEKEDMEDIPKVLLPRFLTALLGIPLLVICIWWGQIPFLLLVFGIILLSLLEYYTLLDETGWKFPKFLSISSTLLLCLLFLMSQSNLGKEIASRIHMDLFFPALFVVLFILLFRMLLSQEKENAFFSVSASILGIFYIALSLCYLLLIRDIRPYGIQYTFFLFSVIWALDTGAYFGGSLFGRHKISQTISPKKTWEGGVIGSLTALGAAILYRSTCFRQLSLRETGLYAILILILAQVSDFSESLLKRNLHAKDSGNLLPGHGGFLDRFDSFLLTTPLYYYVIIWFHRN